MNHRLELITIWNVGLFTKVPYHFPNLHKIGEWEWIPEYRSWRLHLQPHSKDVLQLRLTMSFGSFNDHRIKYSHLTGFSMELEDLIAAWVDVDGLDGREYFWNRISEFWRSHLNAGKRIADPCDFPMDVKMLPMWTETSKEFGILLLEQLQQRSQR